MSQPLSDPRLLVVCEMANNHMGDVEHGLALIDAIGKVAADFPQFGFVFKLQYRDLATFIHPDFQERLDVKYVKRFKETELSEADFLRLKARMVERGFITMCTPFDEASVDRVVKHDFDLLKIASCSLTDWPLLEKAVQTPLPVIASSAGAPLESVDNVVSFFRHREHPLALMHCVALYPTPDDKLELNQIQLLRERYPGARVGFSTHESPDAPHPVLMAVALGATIMERHVHLPTEKYPGNNYSSSPAQFRAWLEAITLAQRMAGTSGSRYAATETEQSSLESLRRGVFVNKALPAGSVLRSEDVLLAIPTVPGQIVANDLSKYREYILQNDLPARAPVMAAQVESRDRRRQVHVIVEEVRKLLKKSRIPLSHQTDFEISHHYGLDRFHEVGAVLINFVNRDYCKKVIVMLPGQSHPEHCHAKKEETFIVQHGEIEISLDGEWKKYGRGDMLLMNRGVKHAFRTSKGVVFEEISSTHFGADSFYTDETIQNNKQRKTHLSHWLD